jgi:hypothetical protein
MDLSWDALAEGFTFITFCMPVQIMGLELLKDMLYS